MPGADNNTNLALITSLIGIDGKPFRPLHLVYFLTSTSSIIFSEQVILKFERIRGANLSNYFSSNVLQKQKIIAIFLFTQLFPNILIIPID